MILKNHSTTTPTFQKKSFSLITIFQTHGCLPNLTKYYTSSIQLVRRQKWKQNQKRHVKEFHWICFLKFLQRLLLSGRFSCSELKMCLMLLSKCCHLSPPSLLLRDYPFGFLKQIHGRAQSTIRILLTKNWFWPH